MKYICYCFYYSQSEIICNSGNFNSIQRIDLLLPKFIFHLPVVKESLKKKTCTSFNKM